MTHTDRLGNTLAIGDKIHGNLWHQTHSHLFTILEFSSPASSPRLKKNPFSRERSEDIMCRVQGGWVRFRDCVAVRDPKKEAEAAERYDLLLHDSHRLNAMENCGVDNWDDGGTVSEYLEEYPCPCSACAEERAEEAEEETANA